MQIRGLGTCQAALWPFLYGKLMQRAARACRRIHLTLTHLQGKEGWGGDSQRYRQLDRPRVVRLERSIRCGTGNFSHSVYGQKIKRSREIWVPVDNWKESCSPTSPAIAETRHIAIMPFPGTAL